MARRRFRVPVIRVQFPAPRPNAAFGILRGACLFRATNVIHHLLFEIGKTSKKLNQRQVKGILQDKLSK